jgi:hypothetical protein
LCHLKKKNIVKLSVVPALQFSLRKVKLTNSELFLE